jgi:hypothetical protein
MKRMLLAVLLAALVATAVMAGNVRNITPLDEPPELVADAVDTIYVDLSNWCELYVWAEATGGDTAGAPNCDTAKYTIYFDLGLLSPNHDWWINNFDSMKIDTVGIEAHKLKVDTLWYGAHPAPSCNKLRVRIKARDNTCANSTCEVKTTYRYCYNP